MYKTIALGDYTNQQFVERSTHHLTIENNVIPLLLLLMFFMLLYMFWALFKWVDIFSIKDWVRERERIISRNNCVCCLHREFQFDLILLIKLNVLPSIKKPQKWKKNKRNRDWDVSVHGVMDLDRELSAVFVVLFIEWRWCSSLSKCLDLSLLVFHSVVNHYLINVVVMCVYVSVCVI